MYSTTYIRICDISTIFEKLFELIALMHKNTGTYQRIIMK